MTARPQAVGPRALSLLSGPKLQIITPGGMRGAFKALSHGPRLEGSLSSQLRNNVGLGLTALTISAQAGDQADGSPVISRKGRTSTVPMRAPGTRPAMAIAS